MLCPVRRVGDRALQQQFSGKEEPEPPAGSRGRWWAGAEERGQLGRRMEVAGLLLGGVAHVRPQALSWLGRKEEPTLRSWCPEGKAGGRVGSTGGGWEKDMEGQILDGDRSDVELSRGQWMSVCYNGGRGGGRR